MRLVLQRVTSAKVVVDGVTVGEIGKGLLVLGGICDSDDSDDGKAAIEWAVRKVLGTRLWEDAAGKSWARSVQQEGLEVLLVSQFTLHGKPCHQRPQPATSRRPVEATSECMRLPRCSGAEGQQARLPSCDAASALAPILGQVRRRRREEAARQGAARSVRRAHAGALGQRRAGDDNARF